MNAHSVDTHFAFPELANGPIEDVQSDPSAMGPEPDAPMGAFRGLVAAMMIQIGFGLLVVLGWQVVQFFR